MRVYEASTRISAEFGGIQDLSRHLSLNCLLCSVRLLPFLVQRSAEVLVRGCKNDAGTNFTKPQLNPISVFPTLTT